MHDLVSRLAMLTAAASLLAPPLPADEITEPAPAPQPTLEDIIGLQARLEEIKAGDLPEDRKIAEIHKLKIAIADAWQQLRDREAPPEDAEPAPDPTDPSDLYFQGWLLSRDAGKLADEQKPAEALEKLDRARRIFDRVARDFPDWKPGMVKGRRAQTAETLALLSKQVRPPQPRQGDLALKHGPIEGVGALLYVVPASAGRVVPGVPASLESTASPVLRPAQAGTTYHFESCREVCFFYRQRLQSEVALQPR